MSESDKSQLFIKQQKEKYGKLLFIEKVIRPDKKGEPDIFALYKGMSVYAEAKVINSLSYRNLHPFEALQLDTLKERADCKAMSIGILYKNNEIRYLMYYDLKKYLNKDDWGKAKIFDLDELWNEWRKCIT